MYVSKSKKFISVALSVLLLCMVMAAGIANAATGFTVNVNSVSGNNGETIVVPVSFSSIPSNGISTADMTITYDSSKLEYVGGSAGNIVTNPTTNLEINKVANGKLKVLFLDYTMSNGYIRQNGVFVNLTFKVLSSQSSKVDISSATFGDKNLSSVSATVNPGTITINGGGTVPTSVVATPTKTPVVVTPTKTPISGSGFIVDVDSVSGNSGGTIVVPVNFTNVPSNGISTADMTITYDSSKLEYVSGAAGTIVTNPTTNLEINKLENGKIKVLFLDYTMSNGYIRQNGVFVNLTFKALSSETSKVDISSATFGDKNLSSLSAKINAGTITINGGGTVTPPPPPQTPSGSYSVSYSENSWGSGATVSMTIKNNSSSAINGWTVNFNYSGNQKITNAWNCSYSQSGTSVTIKNAGYNASIPAGDSVTIGFGISFSGTNTAPTKFTVNSTQVGSGTPTPVATPTKTPIVATPTKTPIVATPTKTPIVATPTKTPIVATPTKTPVVVTPTKTPISGSGFIVDVDSVSGNSGGTIVVPVNFTNVPSNGISTADMTITYDSSKLEYVSGAAGSIVTNPTTNFEINKLEDGEIKVLFLDYTMSNGYIRQNGAFVNLTFKVLSSESSKVDISSATFGDKNLSSLSAKINEGTITINGGGTVTPPPPPQTPSGSYSVSYSENSWGSGATVSMTIKNNSSSAINGWTVNFNYSGNQKIANAWNCSYSQSGTSVTIKNAGYNASIPAGGSVTIGFNISFSGSNTPPTDFTVK